MSVSKSALSSCGTSSWCTGSSVNVAVSSGADNSSISSFRAIGSASIFIKSSSVSVISFGCSAGSSSTGSGVGAGAGASACEVICSLALSEISSRLSVISSSRFSKFVIASKSKSIDVFSSDDVVGSLSSFNSRGCSCSDDKSSAV